MASLHDAKLGLNTADSSWTVFCSTFPVCQRVGIGNHQVLTRHSRRLDIHVHSFISTPFRFDLDSLAEIPP